MSIYIRYRTDPHRGPKTKGTDAINRPMISDGVSQQRRMLQQKLQQSMAISTVGVRTLSGISRKSRELETLARGLGRLETAEEQALAVDDILAESRELWADQNAHVITTMIRDIVVHCRINLYDAARHTVGESLLNATIASAPRLLSTTTVNDISALDDLNQSVLLLVQQEDFEFSANVLDRLEAAGLAVSSIDAEPEKDMAELTSRLRTQILSMPGRAVEQSELSDVVNRVGMLPPHLRGRLLTILVNMLTHTLWMRASSELIGQIGDLIRALPPTCRITPLEAFYNQIHQLPHESARLCHPLISEAVWELPELNEQTFNRTRQDLLEELRSQGEWLSQGIFRPTESLEAFKKRGGDI